MTDRLTPVQMRLLDEIEKMMDLLRLHPRKIREYEREHRTAFLERMRRHLVIGEVVERYTLTDEFLNVILARYFFGKSGISHTFGSQWRAQKFVNFNYFVLEPLALMEKLRFVRVIREVPKAIVADIERLNALRNGLAHAFYPENLRNVSTEWKGKNIFSLDGLGVFADDMRSIAQFFLSPRPRRKTRQPPPRLI